MEIGQALFSYLRFSMFTEQCHQIGRHCGFCSMTLSPLLRVYPLNLLLFDPL